MTDLPKKLRKEFAERIIDWWQSNRRDFPWREEGITPYKILIAEVLLKRTTSTAAEKIFDKLINNFKDITELAKADDNTLKEILSAVGLQDQRTRALKSIAEYICINEGCEIPSDPDSLVKIPHIGFYAANAIMSFAFGMPKAVVDSNVIRILNRCFYKCLGDEKRLRVYQGIADSILPKKHHKEFNWGMIDLGAMVCRYAYPRHSICPLHNICTYNGKD